MGHVEKRIRDKGVVRRARYRDPANREHNKTFTRKVDAERFLASVETSIAKGDWADPALGRITLAEWAPQWLASKRRLKPKTRYGYESLLTSRILPALGDMPLARLERIHVEQWITRLDDEGLSASRIRQAFNVLAAALDTAVANGMLVRNVARGVELPRMARAERLFLSAEQLGRLSDAIEEHLQALVLVLGYGGLRWGEAAALRRGRCDLLRRRIHVQESLSEIGSRLLFGPPKTHRVRSVTLPAFVCEGLARHLEEFVPEGADELVFTTVGGAPLRNSDFRRYYWKRAVSAAGLPPQLTPHELRHTAAALLIANGAGPKSVQAHLGHATITTTFDTYGHLFEGHLDEVMERLEADWRRSRAAHTRPTAPSDPTSTRLT